jgi:hypothetical protein
VVIICFNLINHPEDELGIDEDSLAKLRAVSCTAIYYCLDIIKF